MLLATAAQMRELDKKAIEEIGIPGLALMENAGRGAAEAIDKNFNRHASKGVAVIAGKGNNGGDGFVIARFLKIKGYHVEVYLLADPNSVKGDAKINLNIIKKMGLPITNVTNEDDLLKQKGDISRCGVIVDAIFGTGLANEVKGLYALAIELINYCSQASNCVIVSVDTPSGLNSDTGQIMGVCVKADMTTVLGLIKLGQVVFPGANHVGRFEIIDISMPDPLIDSLKISRHLVTSSAVKGILKKKKVDGHKGRYGHLLTIAGSRGKSGAAVMTSEAALRAGAGLSTLAIPAELNPAMETRLTEVMTAPLPQTDNGAFSFSALEKIYELIENKQALAIGPGISTELDTATLVYELLPHINIPMVIDADGLNILSLRPEIFKKLKISPVLTPHPGEMSRLTGLSLTEIQSNRIKIAEKFAKDHNVVLVLKGARTIIAAPDGRLFINLSGAPVLSTAGTGDVLTGMIGGLLAQGYHALEAAITGVWLHGRAADNISNERGDIGVLASEISEKVPFVFKDLWKESS